MKRCTKCVMPETWDGITFDEDGVCNSCREVEGSQDIDWDERQRRLSKILQECKEYAKEKGSKYDCIIGYSGGKDSTYILWATVVKYHMKPLVVTFDHGFRLPEEGRSNLMRIPKILDCDHLRFTLGNGLRNALCLSASKINGDFCWFCHNGVGALPARIAKQWDILLEIWGEPPSLYQLEGPCKQNGLEEFSKEHFEIVTQAGVTLNNVLPPNYELIDLLPMTWPDNFNFRGIYLGNFEPWDQRKHVEIITRELDWKHYPVEGTYVDWDKVDCPMEPVRDWQKFMKRGLGRTTFQASKDIRDGLISRQEGLRLVEQFDGKRPSILNVFLKEVGMTEEEFNEITRRHIVKVKGNDK